MLTHAQYVVWANAGFEQYPWPLMRLPTMLSQADEDWFGGRHAWKAAGREE